MNYVNGEKIELLDEILTDARREAKVVGFDLINGHEYVVVRTTQYGEDAFYLRADSITPLKRSTIAQDESKL